MNYALFCDDPNLTDVVCDDVVVLTLQYSTQWDTLSHVGQMFDADGDGKPEPVYYNGYRAGIDILGPARHAASRRDQQSERPLDFARDQARRREHGGESDPGARRAHRSRARITGASASSSATTI